MTGSQLWQKVARLEKVARYLHERGGRHVADYAEALWLLKHQNRYRSETLLDRTAQLALNATAKDVRIGDASPSDVYGFKRFAEAQPEMALVALEYADGLMAWAALLGYKEKTGTSLLPWFKVSSELSGIQSPLNRRDIRERLDDWENSAVIGSNGLGIERQHLNDGNLAAAYLAAGYVRGRIESSYSAFTGGNHSAQTNGSAHKASVEEIAALMGRF